MEQMNPTFFSRQYFLCRGQSLVELLIAIGIGSVMILGAITVVAPGLKGGAQVAQSQMAGAAAAELMDNVRGWSETDWHNIYNLAKTSSSPYYLIAGSSTFIAATGTETVPFDGITSGLVGWWRFDEATGTTAYDSTGNAHHGAWSGTPAGTSGYYSAGKLGWAGKFNGSNNWVTVPTSTAFDLTQALSITGWFQTGLTTNQIIVGKCYLSSYYVNTANNILTFWTNGSSLQTPTLSVNNGAFHFFTASFDGTNKRIYVDGVLSATAAGNIATDAYNVEIGSSGCAASLFNGLIDDVRIYNRALSLTEIQKIYGGGFYKRYFYVDNVPRNSSGYIDPAGSINDPSTQKITVVYSWPSLSAPRTFVSYLTRYTSRTAIQTDWTGAGGQSTSSGNFGNTFASSTNIDYATSTGSINIQGY
jgi:type II secretory pathway pseudopilin PulG